MRPEQFQEWFRIRLEHNRCFLQPEIQLGLGRVYTATLSTGVKTEDGNSFDSNFSWSFETRDGVWGAPFPGEHSTGQVDHPYVSVNAKGERVALWVQYADGTNPTGIYASFYDPKDQTWSAPNLLCAPLGSSSANDPHVELSDSGNAVAAWRQKDVTESRSVWGTYYSVDSGWEPCIAMEEETAEAHDPRVAINGSGEAVVTWYQTGGDRIRANRWVPGTGWTGTIRIDSAPLWAHYPDVGIADNGETIIAWHQWDNSTSPGKTDLYASRYVPTAGWTAPIAIESDSVGTATASVPRVSMDRNGNAVSRMGSL